ncbi:hypothetical protein ICN86_15015 [Aquisalinus flavus]|uniref:hypothetical protein n=1 Tax=Aquisalinus flavus TaxID=1526572 RepID=UPI00165F42DB|nr:hypothetical protein [Aquisalinus flavus]MBD0428133.1 hypothetical protein [Aquisalinus flavus]
MTLTRHTGDAMRTPPCLGTIGETQRSVSAMPAVSMAFRARRWAHSSPCSIATRWPT